jgi:hypothetical protein
LAGPVVTVGVRMGLLSSASSKRSGQLITRLPPVGKAIQRRSSVHAALTGTGDSGVIDQLCVIGDPPVTSARTNVLTGIVAEVIY